MQSVTRKRAQDLYFPWLIQLVDYGDVVEARGRQFQEILDAVSVVEEPQDHCILIPSRRWNPWLAMSESLWILAGRNDIAALKPYNSRITEFSDDGKTLYGAYGLRIYDQIDEIIGRLQRDPSDRRAVLQIWDHTGGYYGHYDLTENTKDPPCNNLVYFKLRQNKLHMTVICRSNDIHWGLFAVNLPTFGILQEYIAARLGVEIGTQTHLSNSLHVYTDSEPAKVITRRMMYDEPDNYVKYPEHDRVFTDLHVYKEHQGFATACSAVLEDVPLGSGIDEVAPFLPYARVFLRAYRERNLNIIPEDKRYSDWTTAAKIFTEKVWK